MPEENFGKSTLWNSKRKREKNVQQMRENERLVLRVSAVRLVLKIAMVAFILQKMMGKKS